MREIGIARRYVRALYGVASETSEVFARKILADLHWFDSLLAEDGDLRRFLEDPRVSREQKKQSLEKVLAGDLQDLTRDFLLWVVDRGRAALLPLAAREYEALLQEAQGIAVADVYSAVKLEDASREELLAMLEKSTGKKIKLVAHVDPALLGGIRIRIGSTLLDGSIRRQLADLREELLKSPLPAVPAFQLAPPG